MDRECPAPALVASVSLNSFDATTGDYVSATGPRAPATQLASWIRELSPSLLSMLVTWVVTVRSEMKSPDPICWLVSPSAMSCAISSSRRVRVLGGWLVRERGDAPLQSSLWLTLRRP